MCRRKIARRLRLEYHFCVIFNMNKENGFSCAMSNETSVMSHIFDVSTAIFPSDHLLVEVEGKKADL